MTRGFASMWHLNAADNFSAVTNQWTWNVSDWTLSAIWRLRPLPRRIPDIKDNLPWKDMSRWELCKLSSHPGCFEMLQCTVCSASVPAGKQPDSPTDRSSAILYQWDERQICDNVLHNLHAWCERWKGSVSFTDTLFTFSTSEVLSASAHLCPLSCSYVPPLPSAQQTSKPFFLTSVSMLHDCESFCLFCSVFSVPSPYS